MTGRIRDLPQDERPRERLLRLGASALSQRELLAILLRSGRRGESAIDFAQRILKEAGGLSRVARLSVDQLVKNHAMGRVQAITLSAALELARRVGGSGAVGEKFSEPEHVKAYLRENHSHYAQEVTRALLLDARHRLIKDVECYRGTLDRAMVEPREILKHALLEDGASVILCHNHPSGDPTPSPEDVDFTRRLKRAADVVGVKLLDHFIVGREGAVSLRESGPIWLE